MMEVILKTDLDALPAAIEFNFDQLREELSALMQRYDGILVENTKEAIAAAKSDRADLSRLATALEEARKRVKKRCMAPYDAFAAKVADLVSLIAGPRDALDVQIKRFAEEARERRMGDISTAYTADYPDIAGIVPIDRVMDSTWLNASVRDSSWQKGLAERAGRIRADLEALRGALVGDRARYAQEAMGHYTRTLDIAATFRFVEGREKEDAALAEYAKKRAAEEAQGAPQTPPEPEPAQEPAPAPAKPSDPVLEYTVRIRWPRSRLVEWRVWMQQRGLTYEKL